MFPEKHITSAYALEWTNGLLDYLERQSYMSYKLVLCRLRRLRNKQSHCKGSLKRLLLSRYHRYFFCVCICDPLCGLVVRVSGDRS
jgi:hypothetical protein